jgi:predicted O-methyltransferase YrrM
MIAAPLLLLHHRRRPCHTVACAQEIADVHAGRRFFLPAENINQATNMNFSSKAKECLLSFPGMWLLLIPLKLYAPLRNTLRTQLLVPLRCALASRELTNHSYHNTEISANRLATVLANIDGVSPELVRRYCHEARDNPVLQQIYREARAREKILCNLTDAEMRAGRQLLYYCLTRAIKPRVVFEAGTAHGIGSLLILHALRLNQAEGYPGRLATVDLNPNAGRILKHLPPDYRAMLSAELSDTERALFNFDLKIDLFFHDTVNVPEHEKNHYELLKGKISPAGVICSTWGTSGMLAAHSERTGRRYLEFTNQAQGHWCSDTIGISLPPANRAAVATRRMRSAVEAL